MGLASLLPHYLRRYLQSIMGGSIIRCYLFFFFTDSPFLTQAGKKRKKSNACVYYHRIYIIKKTLNCWGFL